MNVLHSCRILHSFSIKNICYDKMDLRLFCFHVTSFINIYASMLHFPAYRDHYKVVLYSFFSSSRFTFLILKFDHFWRQNFAISQLAWWGERWKQMLLLLVFMITLLYLFILFHTWQYFEFSKMQIIEVRWSQFSHFNDQCQKRWVWFSSLKVKKRKTTSSKYCYYSF